MSSERSLSGRSLVVVAKGTVLATVTFLAVAPVTSPARQVTTERHGAVTAVHTRSDRPMDHHECSPTGFGPDVVPRSALVRRDGRIRHVSFEEGWAVNTGAAHGRFVAVCRV